jgi:hypothetical protein
VQAQKRADAQLQKQNTLLINQNKMLANNILTLEQKFAAITEGMVIRAHPSRHGPRMRRVSQYTLCA